MIKFKGKSIDARYDFESLFLKEIEGSGYETRCGDSYIRYEGDWIEVDPDTVVAININTMEEKNMDIERLKVLLYNAFYWSDCVSEEQLNDMINATGITEAELKEIGVERDYE